MKKEIKKLSKSEIEIELEINEEHFESFYSKALKKISADMEIPGFRKGKAPENILLSKIPEAHILEEMAEMAISEAYPKILEEEKLDVIDRPQISITKIARKNPLGVKIKLTIIPEFELPEYKKIAKEVMDGLSEKEKNTDITKEEIEETITKIREIRKKKTETKEEEEKENEIPELDDDFVKSLGNFENVADFRKKIEENLKLEKENTVREKNRLRIIEKIIDQTEIETPEVLIESEIDKILYRMEADVAQMGLKFEDYLKHLNKSVEELRKELRKDGEKKAKLGLILNEIAKKEKMELDEAEVEHEVNHILEHYKDADKERARIHVENVLTNEKIFEMLESQ